MVDVVRLNVHDIGKEFINRASLDKFADKRDCHHFNRQPLDRYSEIRDIDLHPLTNRPFPGYRVERRIHHLIPAVVLRQYFVYIGQTACHTNHS